MFFQGIYRKYLHFIHLLINGLNGRCLGCMIFLHRLDFPALGHWALNTTAVFLNAGAFFKNAVMFLKKTVIFLEVYDVCRKSSVYHTPLFIMNLQIVFPVYEMQVVSGNPLYIRARV